MCVYVFVSTPPLSPQGYDWAEVVCVCVCVRACLHPHLSLSLQGYDWAEVVLLGIIPVIIIGVSFIAVIVRLIFLLNKKCGGCRPARPYMQDPYGQR